METQTQEKIRTQTKELVSFLTSMTSELDDIEKSGIEHCFGTVDEAALIVKAGLSYTRQLAGMWRRLSVEWMGRAVTLLAPMPRGEERA